MLRTLWSLTTFLLTLLFLAAAAVGGNWLVVPAIISALVFLYSLDA
jgi:hypothetical protein